ncbi:MAG: Rrf2 family transcriptional regulator [Chloroflexi bacterium]|nr:Rrf2 family transcriptional regulator [Chloroflexota bacterium]
MRFSTREQYGLRAMARLSRFHGQGPVSLAEVAEAEGLPLPYLEQIMASLRRAGLVQSTRGAYGGYELGRAPEVITAGDIIRALEGSIVPIQCLGDCSHTSCAREASCATRSVWEQVHDRLVETLDGITLADLQSPQPAPHAKELA